MRINAQAYSKVNLTLEVLGHRSDGYHEVRTVLQTIDLADDLIFESSHRLSVESSARDLNGEGNLVWRAAKLLRSVSKTSQGAEIYLQKKIPIGVGLGGGSSDAAVTISALNLLWGLHLNDSTLQALASQLGSDVPFFLKGGIALAEGHGELVTFLPPGSPLWMVLVCPIPRHGGGIEGFTKTKHLYSFISGEHYTDGRYTNRLVSSIMAGSGPQGYLFNVFEKIAPDVFDGFMPAYNALARAGSVHLSGTGPSLYTLVATKQDIGPILKALNKEGFMAYGVRTIQPEMIGLG